MAERRSLIALAAALAALAVAAVALLVGPADARQFSLRQGSSPEFGPREDGSARAACRRRGPRHLISGGFAADTPWRADFNSTMAIFDSAPSRRRGWRIAAANFAGEPETITASALCARRSARVRDRRARVAVPAGGTAKATARCRRGEEAIAGGFKAPGFAQGSGPEVVAIESRRKGRRKWRVVAYDNSKTQPGRLVAVARCAKRRPRLRTVRVSGIAVDQAPRRLAAGCDRGEELWSGGFVADFQSFDPFAVIIADRSYPHGRKWVSRFVGFQTGGKVTALAYCRERG